MTVTVRLAVFMIVLSGAPLARAGDNRAESDVAHNAGRTYLAEGRADLAAEQFKRALELDDKNYHSYKGLGLAYVQLKNFKEAEKAQRKCLAMNSDFADARNDLGATLMLLGKRAEARKEWLTAYASPFNPTPDQTAWNLGNSYLEENNLPEAVRWYEASLQRNAMFAPAHASLARTLLAQGRVDDAVRHLEKAMKTLADDMTLSLTLGDAYYKAGRFAEARGKLEGVVRKDPVGELGKQASEMLKHFPK